MFKKNRHKHKNQQPKVQVEKVVTAMEVDQPLSKSVLWDKLRGYYLSLGIEAWKSGAVPSFITSNNFIGTVYAKLITAYIKDYIKNNNGNIDKSEPFYIIEVGAGHAKLSFYVARALIKIFKEEGLDTSLFKYVMTDIAKRNIDYWMQHEGLKELMEQGVMDCAVFDADRETEIKLLYSNKVITKGSLSKPISMVGNYIIDTLPHDYFESRDNKLHASLITTNLEHNKDVEIKESNVLNYMKHSFNPKLIEGSYYNNQILDKILHEYAQDFEEASFLIPIGGIKCIDTLKSLTKDDFILISADKGDAVRENFEGIEAPFIEANDYAALMVNFDALGRYFSYQGGFNCNMPEKSSTFQVTVSSFADSTKYPQLINSYKQNVFSFGPNDFFVLEDSISSKMKNPPLELIMSILRMSQWDPHIFYKFRDNIVEGLDDKTDDFKLDVAKDAMRVWDNFFHMDEEDIPFEIARILYTIDLTEDAIRYFEYSIKYFGKETASLYNLGLCLQELERFEEAMQCFNEVIEIDPNYEDVKLWQKTVYRKMSSEVTN